MKKTVFRFFVIFCLSTAIGMVISGCATTLVKVPPQVNLDTYNLIGIIRFSTSISNRLDDYATQQFMQYAQEGQPQARFLSLGTKRQVLESIQREKLDAEALKLIGKKYNVNSVAAGDMKFSDAKSNVTLGEGLTTLNSQTTIESDINIYIWDITNGSVVWTGSRHGSWTLTDLEINFTGIKSLRSGGIDTIHERATRKSVYAATETLREHYKRVRVER